MKTRCLATPEKLAAYVLKYRGSIVKLGDTVPDTLGQEVERKTVPEKHRFPRYRCHKIVNAALIESIIPSTYNEGGILVRSKDIDGEMLSLHFNKPWVDKFEPVEGGYVVYYEDGYISFSPPGVFEYGYDLLDDYGQEERQRLIEPGPIRFVTDSEQDVRNRLLIDTLEKLLREVLMAVKSLRR